MTKPNQGKATPEQLQGLKDCLHCIDGTSYDPVSIIKEFDKAPKNASWEPQYSIFEMAQHITALTAELKEAHKTGAALSAHQCIFTDDNGLVGDEYGHQICLKDEKIKKLEEVIRWYFNQNIVVDKEYTLKLIADSRSEYYEIIRSVTIK